MRSTVNGRGQVTLPKRIRDRLGLRAGMRIDFEIRGDGMLTARMPTRGAEGLFALSARPGEASRTVEDMEAAVTVAVVERRRRR